MPFSPPDRVFVQLYARMTYEVIFVESTSFMPTLTGRISIHRLPFSSADAFKERSTVRSRIFMRAVTDLNQIFSLRSALLKAFQTNEYS